MQIETYQLEEINSSDAATMAADSTAIELIEKLGLDGQKKFTNAETATRATFPRMNKIENAVFSELFPEKTRVEEFAVECIPVRVLEALDRAKESGAFVRFEVWHGTYKKDDPILVGIAGRLDPQTWNPHYVSSATEFLIARWGKALEPFAKLAKEAKVIWLTKRRATLKREIQERQAKLDRIQEDAELTFLTGETGD